MLRNYGESVSIVTRLRQLMLASKLDAIAAHTERLDESRGSVQKNIT